jgi:hypothetical protein
MLVDRLSIISLEDDRLQIIEKNSYTIVESQRLKREGL